MSVRALTPEVLDAGYALAVQLLRNRHDAADAVQDSAQRFLKQPGKYDARKGPMRGWFLRVVRNGCIDRMRRSKRRTTESLEPNVHAASADLSPESMAETNELHCRLRNELQQLSDEHREIILLRDWHDLSYSEITAVLRIPAGTVMSRLSRAREELRLRMQRFR